MRSSWTAKPAAANAVNMAASGLRQERLDPNVEDERGDREIERVAGQERERGGEVGDVKGGVRELTFPCDRDHRRADVESDGARPRILGVH